MDEVQPRQMRLKAKYRSAHRSRYNGGENPAPKKHRRKLSDAMKRGLAPQPKVVLHVLANGRSRYEIEEA